LNYTRTVRPRVYRPPLRPVLLAQSPRRGSRLLFLRKNTAIYAGFLRKNEGLGVEAVRR